MRQAVFALLLIFSALPAFAADQKESAYDRVMRTRTIRCAYILLPPEFSKDINTGKFSGAAYDVMEEVGKRLGLKVEWTEQVDFQSSVAGLNSGRYDAVCFSFYRYSAALSAADFSTPLFYTSTGVFARGNDRRFDQDLSAINSPNVTIATIDGEMSQFIAADDYPKAKTLSMPNMTDLSQMLKNVETGKADIAFVNGAVAAGYLKANPGKLKNVAAGNPVRFFSHGLMFPKGQYDFVRMIDLALAEMHDQGFIERILRQHDPEGRTYLRVARPYEMPQ